MEAEGLPSELYHVIAAHSEGAYKALLALPPFARSVSVSVKYDYMMLFGHSVTIDKNKILWYQNGQLHRVDGPAIENANGDRVWYQNGQRHRVDGPAIEYADGDHVWYQNGQRHRVDGPAIEYADGDRVWYQNGQHHRGDGPAVEYAKYTL